MSISWKDGTVTRVLALEGDVLKYAEADGKRTIPADAEVVLYKFGSGRLVEAVMEKQGNTDNHLPKVTMRVSSEAKDRDGDIIRQKGWQLGNWRSAPRVQWAHKYDILPIARGMTVKVRDLKDDPHLLSTALMWNGPGAGGDFAREIFAMLSHKPPFLDSASVGFIPLEAQPLDKGEGDGPGSMFGGFEITKQDLLEWSVVPIGSNPDTAIVDEKKILTDRMGEAADVLSLSKKTLVTVRMAAGFADIKEPEEDKQDKTEGVPPVEDEADVETPELDDTPDEQEDAPDKDPGEDAEEDAQTEGTAAEAAAELSEDPDAEKSVDDMTKSVIPYKDLGQAPEDDAWDGPAEVAAADVDALLLMATWYDKEKPDAKSSFKLPHHKAAGEHLAVLRGVIAAGNAVQGARGGIDVPDSDIPGIKAHLEKHYAEWDRVAPWNEDDEKTIEQKRGAVLSAKTRKAINAAVEALTASGAANSAAATALKELLATADAEPDDDKDVPVPDEATAVSLDELKDEVKALRESMEDTPDEAPKTEVVKLTPAELAGMIKGQRKEGVANAVAKAKGTID